MLCGDGQRPRERRDGANQRRRPIDVPLAGALAPGCYELLFGVAP